MVARLDDEEDLLMGVPAEAACVTVPPEYDLAAIAAAAGNGDVEGRSYSNGKLYVAGVTQAELNASLAAYDSAPSTALIEQGLVTVFNDFLDSVAGQRRYDTRWTCALRAGFEGPFQAEGQVFAAWMDECNMIAYGVMADVKAGRRAAPSPAELLAMMPQIQWPPSPIPEGAV